MTAMTFKHCHAQKGKEEKKTLLNGKKVRNATNKKFLNRNNLSKIYKRRYPAFGGTR